MPLGWYCAGSSYPLRSYTSVMAFCVRSQFGTNKPRASRFVVDSEVADDYLYLTNCV